jgi:hypothetical protein
MVPIFEQGQGQGIGHTFNTFLTRFIEICDEHLKSDRAKAFAFILYDFHDEATRDILRNQGGFTRLDRLSGHDLSVFYLHSDNKKLLKAFNDIFLQLFDIPAHRQLPFVLFFKIEDKDAKEVEVIELEQSNLMFAFDELYSVIESYVDKLNKGNSKNSDKPNKFVRIFKSVKKITGEKIIEYLVTKSAEYAGQYIM